jgi:hypothetical protein
LNKIIIKTKINIELYTFSKNYYYHLIKIPSKKLNVYGLLFIPLGLILIDEIMLKFKNPNIDKKYGMKYTVYYEYIYEKFNLIFFI